MVRPKALAVLLTVIAASCTSGPDPGNLPCPPPQVGGDGVTEIPVGGRPESLIPLQERMWIQRFADEGPELVALDPQAGTVDATSIPLPRGMIAFAADRQERVWSIAGGPGSGLQGKGAVYRMGLPSGRVEATKTIPGRPSDIALGHGSLWVTSEAGNVLLKLDPDTLETLAAIEIPQGPHSIDVGAGAVWVKNSFGRTSTFRVDPTTARVVKEYPDVTIEAFDGEHVWVVGPGRPNGAIFRMDPVFGYSVGKLLGTPIAPVTITVLDGSVWVARWVFYCEQKHPIPEGPPIVDWEVQQLDPLSMTYTGPQVPTGAEGPQDLIPAFGALWSLRRSNESIVRIEVDALRDSA